MKTIDELRETPHLIVCGPQRGFPEEFEVYYGFVSWPDLKFKGNVIFGRNENGLMEHVSICSANKLRTPSWEVMCRTKAMFWRPEEMVVQIHPAESRYVHGVGNLQNVLHLWRPKDGNFEILNHPELWD